MVDGFLQPEQQRGTLGNIGLGLSAFGEGVAGRGQQFLAGQQQQQQRLSLERQKAAAEDLRRAQLLLGNGDIEGIRGLAAERTQLITQLGGDPSDTNAILQLAEASIGGDENALKLLGNEINTGVQLAAEQGLIKLPKEKVAVPLSPAGKVAADIKAGFIKKGSGQSNFTGVNEFAPGKFGGVNQDTGVFEEIPTDIKTDTFKTIEFRDKQDAKRFDLTDKLIKGAKADKRIDSHLKVISSMDRLNAAAEDTTGASDVSMIFSFMKMLDPGSVVRESEFQLASDTAGAPEFVKAAANKLISGERLTEVSRGNFIKEAEKIFSRSTKTADNALRPIENRARKNKLDPEAIRSSIFGVSGDIPSSLPQGTVSVGNNQFRLPDGTIVEPE